MAQLYYKYGTMNSGKSIEILKVAHNYEEQGKSVALMTSSLDTRDAYGVVSSRIGLRREAIPISSDMDLFAYVENLADRPSCILVDECQFLSKKNVCALARVVDDLNIPVMCFGLNFLKGRITCSLWQIKLRKSKRSASTAPKKQSWFYG